MPLYLRLFHGRADPADVLTDWGADGPTIGPFDTFHITYCDALELWNGETAYELKTEKGLVHFDGIFYGDLEITEAALSAPVISLRAHRKGSRACAIPSHEHGPTRERLPRRHSRPARRRARSQTRARHQGCARLIPT